MFDPSDPVSITFFPCTRSGERKQVLAKKAEKGIGRSRKMGDTLITRVDGEDKKVGTYLNSHHKIPPY